MSKNTYLYTIVFFSALGGLLFGYDTGVISGAILFIRKDFDLSSALIELVVSGVLFGAVLGAIVAGVLSDRFGRKKLLLVTALVFTLATLGSAMTNDAGWLIVARVCIGIALGISSMTVPMYIAEISPPHMRGRLVSVNQLFVTVGILVSYIVDLSFAASGDWRWMIGLGAIPAAVFGLGMLFLPESPRWLMKMGRMERAKKILCSITSETEAMKEIADMQKTPPKVKRTPWLRRMFIVGIGLAIFQQITGINTIIYYSPIIFELAGFKTATSAVLATGIVGVVNFAFTIVALWLLDKSGRRKLLLIGLAGMILSLVALGFAFMPDQVSTVVGWLTLVSLMVFVASFAISLGPIFWLLVAEIYPLAIRGKAISVATITNWGANLIVALTFLTLIDVLKPTGTFWLYGGLSIIAWFFSYFLVPETKDKTLEQIELEHLQRT